MITRLSSDSQPPADSLYGITIDTLRCDALPVRFDLATWTDRFLTQWPAGSPGHRSYYTRIIRGTHLQLQQAARNGVQLTARKQGGLDQKLSGLAVDFAGHCWAGNRPAATSH